MNAPLRSLFCLVAAFALQASLLPAASEREKLLLIVGAPGEPQYQEGFAKAAATWTRLAQEADVDLAEVAGEDDSLAAKERIRSWIEELDPNSPLGLWIVYLGHGSHSPIETKLNLLGPDLSASELSQWLEPIESPLVFIHGGSASSPFLPALSRPGRVVITATRSGAEQNYARFGEFFAQALASERSDLDLDGQVSLLEAFVTASSSVETFYKEAGRLTSEHALLDDNGDGRGADASAFRGLRHVEAGARNSTPDGAKARLLAFVPAADSLPLTPEQRILRETLESELEALKRQKNQLPEDEYFRQLETLFNALSPLYLDTESAADDS